MASELDNQWRARMRPDAPATSPTPEAGTPPSPAHATTRPKLNLQKRTVSETDHAPSPAPLSDSKSSPFGAARPVDTASKEKEVEQKRMLAHRQRKEAEEKAKAERAEEKRLAKEKAELEKTKEAKEAVPKESKEPKEVASPKENGEEEQPQAQTAVPPKFDILRRAESSANDMGADGENEDDAEDHQPAEDKAVKPKETVPPPPSRANGSWRNGQTPRASHANTSAAPLEEDGWSTVSKNTKQRNNRRHAPARTQAS